MARTSSRDKILDALETVLIERGAGAVTLDAVCETAGVSKGGLLYHFASKAELYAGLTDRLAEGIRKEVTQAPSDPGELVRWFIFGAVPSDNAERALWRSLLAGVRLEEHHDDATPPIARLLDEWARPLDRFEPGLALQIRLVADGLYFNALVGAPRPPEDLLDRLIAPLAAAARA